MSFSFKTLQKSSSISDGKNNFKGGLSITITYESLFHRVRGFAIFLHIALRALIDGRAELAFFDINTTEATSGMTKIDISRE